MAFTPSCIKSIQQVMGVNGANAINAVNVANTMLVYGGNQSTDNSGFPCGNGSCYITLASSTSVTVVSHLGGCFPAFTVIEFYPGFLRQAVQYNAINLAGVTTASIGITTVSAKAFVMYLGFSENINRVQADMATLTPRVFLASTSVVQANRSGTGGANSPDSGALVGFCVVDPK